jgi:hypothetical protein
MKAILLFLVLISFEYVFPQCTPANLQPTSNLNTPGYTLNSAFNSGTSAPATISNLSNGLVSFSAAVSGTATWGAFVAGNPATGGIQLQNDVTVGNYIYVQPTNAPNNVPANSATYTFNFSEAVYNLSFKAAGLNNNDRIIVTAFNGATPVTINASNFSSPDAGITVSTNTAIGTSTAGGTSVNTNRVTISIAGPVTKIVIQSGKSDNSTSTVTLGFTSFGYTRCVTAPADFNSTFVNTAVSGNVSTNDVVPAGTQYGTPVADPANPNTSILPVINADGTYSFTSSVAGVFKFRVPMCPPGVVVPNCPNVPLVITVSQPSVYSNNPIVNIDRATTAVNTAVTLQTLANDRPGNNSPVALNPASVTVTTAPLHGSTSVNTTNGNITFTPTSSYVGFDTLVYRVCDLSSPTPRCATTSQIITIQAASTPNNTAAADDFNSAALDRTASGNVKTNDSDPQSNTQTVTAQSTTINGKGTLVLNTDGSYVFTPATGFSGPVSFPYQICDNGSPVACTNATLYILIYPSFTLPLDLTSFKAAVQNADTRLTWTSENQVNVDHFEIERRSGDGNTYEKVGVVAVNNASAGSYSFVDVNAKQKITKGYYRLKIVDSDGNYRYSAVVLVTFGNNMVIDVRPTVVKRGDAVTIVLAASNTPTTYTGYLYNSTGQLVQSWRTRAGGSSQIETRELNAGTYILKMSADRDVITQKIVVQ